VGTSLQQAHEKPKSVIWDETHSKSSLEGTGKQSQGYTQEAVIHQEETQNARRLFHQNVRVAGGGDERVTAAGSRGAPNRREEQKKHGGL